MCGRYTLFTEKEQREIHKIIKEVDDKLNQQGKFAIKVGEIYPTNTAPVLVADNENISAEAAVWGFPKYQGKGVIINACAETAPKKPMFAKPFTTMRCVVPCAGFFEWDSTKTKYLFNAAGADIVYMAGIAKMYKQERRYVILTTNANESMLGVHNRMPVTLGKEDVGKWLMDYRFALQILRQVPACLLKRVESPQQLKFI